MSFVVGGGSFGISEYSSKSASTAAATLAILSEIASKSTWLSFGESILTLKIKKLTSSLPMSWVLFLW